MYVCMYVCMHVYVWMHESMYLKLSETIGGGGEGPTLPRSVAPLAEVGGRTPPPCISNTIREFESVRDHRGRGVGSGTPEVGRSSGRGRWPDPPPPHFKNIAQLVCRGVNEKFF